MQLGTAEAVGGFRASGEPAVVERVEQLAGAGGALLRFGDLAEKGRVGCGVLGILPQLCARVGTAGRSSAWTSSPACWGSPPSWRLAAGSRSRPSAPTPPPPGCPRASSTSCTRALLINVTHRESVLAEFVRLARPGGTVALQEPDAAAWVCDPPHPAFDRLRDRLVAVYPRTGRDFHLGRRLGRMLRDAGVRDVRMRATSRLTHPGDYYHTFLLALLRTPLLADPELTAARLDDDCAALREHLAGAHTVTCMPLLWPAWGSAP